MFSNSYTDSQTQLAKEETTSSSAHQQQMPPVTQLPRWNHSQQVEQRTCFIYFIHIHSQPFSSIWFTVTVIHFQPFHPFFGCPKMSFGQDNLTAWHSARIPNYRHISDGRVLVEQRWQCQTHKDKMLLRGPEVSCRALFPLWNIYLNKMTPE